MVHDATFAPFRRLERCMAQAGIPLDLAEMEWRVEAEVACCHELEKKLILLEWDFAYRESHQIFSVGMSIQFFKSVQNMREEDWFWALGAVCSDASTDEWRLEITSYEEELLPTAECKSLISSSSALQLLTKDLKKGASFRDMTYVEIEPAISAIAEWFHRLPSR
jgi:hypothetical protein